MEKLLQTRLHLGGQLGNCFSTVIACVLNKKSAEDVIQIQECYSDVNWKQILKEYLLEEGVEITDLDGHLYNDEYYFVEGDTKRGVFHICIYQNGKLYHDPHPSGDGLVNEKKFSIIVKH